MPHPSTMCMQKWTKGGQYAQSEGFIECIDVSRVLIIPHQILQRSGSPVCQWWPCPRSTNQLRLWSYLRGTWRAWNHELEAHTITIYYYLLYYLLLSITVYYYLLLDIKQGPRTFTGIQTSTLKTYSTLQAAFLAPFYPKIRPPSLPLQAHVVEKEKAAVAVPLGAQAQREGLPQCSMRPQLGRCQKWN